MAIKKLPKYASTAARDRPVEITCRGNCGCGRIAQIADTRNSNGGRDIVENGYAECLFCGYKATDISNWRRILTVALPNVVQQFLESPGLKHWSKHD